ncbi:MAG: TonB-dependent receptor [Bryobacteraceae bacterium]|nr:TonB-dependent receptor [Bryobacteraceae bacterium]
MSRRLARLVISVLALVGVILAQSEVGTANLSGTVTDPSGAAIAGAKVTVSSKATGLTRVTETSEAGLYNLPRLPVGSYDLAIEAQGFKSARKAEIPLSVGAQLTFDVRLEVGATSEAITVTGEVPIVETTRTQASTVVNQKAVNDLPINGRNFLDFTLLTPGVVRDVRQGDISFGGQRGTANSLLVDGGDTNNNFFGQSMGRIGSGRSPYSFSQDAVLEFQVKTNGYDAEIGRAGGGVVNVITKSGTNDFHGGAFWFFRDRAMNANTSINNSRRIARPIYHFNQFGGNLGGPVKRDKLFFFFNYDGQRNATPNEVFLQVAAPPDEASQRAFQTLLPFTGVYQRRFDNDTYLGKGDWNISDTQRLSVRYNASRFTGTNLENGGINRSLESTGNSLVTNDQLSAAYTKTFGAAVVYDGRFIYMRDDQPGLSNSTNPQATIQQGGQTVMVLGRNFFSPRYTNIKKFQTVQTVSYVRGRHTYKIGADLNFDRIDNFFPGNFSGAFLFPSYAAFTNRQASLFTQGFAGEGTDGALTRPNLNEYAFFVQDNWRATDRLTLNYGIRYDLFDYAQPKVRNTDAGLNLWSLDTGRINQDNNNWAGRLGFAYRLTDDDRVVVRGGYGIFYARTPSIMIGTAHSQNGIQVQTYTLTGAAIPTYPNILSAPPTLQRRPDIWAFARDYVQPQTHQWNFQIERRVTANLSVIGGYLGVRGLKLSRTRDVNLFPAEAVQGTISTGGTITFFRHPGAQNAPARPATNFGRISLFDSGGDSIYHGGFVQVTKRYSRNLQFLASYTFSKVIDSAPDQTSVTIGGGDDAKQAQNTLLPNLDRGPGVSDVNHRFVLSGVYDITFANRASSPFVKYTLGDWQLALITQVESGRRFSPMVSNDPNNNQMLTDRTPGVGRNVLLGPGFAAVDVRLSKQVPLGTERIRLRLIGEAFNITNRANFTNWNMQQWLYTAATRVFTPNPNFLARTGTADPRILQIAAKITF